MQPALPFARTSDPVQSHIVNASIHRDGSMAAMILDALSKGNTPWTDDDLWIYLELTTHRRLQRNVIARARGLLERSGHITRCPDRITPAGPRLTFCLSTRYAQVVDNAVA